MPFPIFPHKVQELLALMPRRHERRGYGLTSTSRGWTEANIRSSISKSDLFR
jgi:hypothetical protein